MTVAPHAPEINALLDQARHEEFLLQAADSSEFMRVAVDDFTEEILRARQHEPLMALLDTRAQPTQMIHSGGDKGILDLDGRLR